MSMKLGHLITSIIVVLSTHLLLAQVVVPKQIGDRPFSDTSDVKLTEMYSNFTLLRAQNDTTLISQQRQADRWFSNELARMSIINDSTFGPEAYNESMKQIFLSNLFCGKDDKSRWENVGPFDVDQNNGIINAIVPRGNNLDEIVMGGPFNGLFKSINHGVTWVCVTDNLPFPVLGIKEIIAAPNNPDYLIATTGTTSGLDALQAGYIWSDDFGDTWNLGDNQLANNGNYLAQFKDLMYHESQNGLIFGVTTKQIVYSLDYGLNWNQLNFPTDFNAIEHNFDKSFNFVHISGNRIHITAKPDWGRGARYWMGELVFSGGSFQGTINWDSENAEQFYTGTPIISTNNNPTDVNPNNYVSPASPGIYRHRIGNQSCSGGVIPRWQYILTDGWDKDTVGNEVFMTCIHDVNNPVNKEIYTSVNKSFQDFWWQQDEEVEVRALIPKGAKLKIAITPYAVPSSNGVTSVCSLNLYDYDSLFGTQNIIYESVFQTQNSLIDTIQTINFSSIGVPNIVSPSVQLYRFYIILEYDNTYIGGEFRMERLGVYLDNRPDYIEFSNNAFDRFYVHSNASTSNENPLFQTTDDGLSYTLVKERLPYDNLANNSDVGGYDKSVLLASLNDTNTVYYGGIRYMKKYNKVDDNDTVMSFQYGGGDHDDQRDGIIVSVGGKDHLLIGNDGGIAEITDAIISDQIISLNGDWKGNMIYNLDIHEQNKNIVLGLQDNGTREIYSNTPGDVSLNGFGDGTLAMVRQDDPSNFVMGDPQGYGVYALKDKIDTGGLGIVLNPLPSLLKGEAFLGMKLDEYRFDPYRFITGISKKDNNSDAGVILNRAPNVTQKVLIEGSSRIGAVGVCQRFPTVAYAGESIYKQQGRTRIYKTTDDGFTWDSLSPDLYMNGVLSPNNFNSTDFWKHINDLAVDPLNPDLFYIGMSGITVDPVDHNVIVHEKFRVLRSNDGGSSLVDWSEGLPSIPINTLLTVESNKRLVFCGTDVGVHYRMDGMDRWECFSTNLPKMRVTDLVYDYCSNELLASSYGRGVWSTPVNLDLGDAYVHEDITTNTTWSTDRDIRGDIRIRTGQTLTITATGTVHMDANRKIIVEPGAKLIVDGGTITNRCNAYWDGIEVMGNSALTQNAANQGMVITKNNATIEYAVKAIKTWKTDQWNTTGGIVDVSNTTFKNNKVSIFFYPYNNVLPSGFEPVNIGTVKNCNFLWNDDFIGIRPKSAIILYNVNGVTIQGCDFRDDRTSIVGEDERAAGIFSLDANFRVMARPTSLPLAVHNEFGTGGGYDVNNFINLEDGVVIMGVNSVRAPIVDHCNFNNVKQPLQILANDNSIITRNLVDFNTQRPADIQSSQGFQLANSSGYHIEGNTFVSNAAGVFKGGILSWDSGSEHNLLYRNYFNNQSIGLYAQGINSNTDPFVLISGNFKGLYWKCNEMVNGQYDLANFVIPGGDGQGVRLIQGNSGESAGNYFSNASLVDVQLRHTDTYYLNYFYNLDVNPLEFPTVVDPNVNTVFTDVARKCDSRLNSQLRLDNRPLVAASSLGTITTAHESLSSDLETHRATLADGLASGDAETVHTLVATMNEDPAYALIKLNDLTPYLSASVLEEVGAFVPDFVSYTDYFTLIVDNIEATRTPALRVFLDGLAWDATYADSLRQAMKTGITSRGSLEQTIMRDEAELEVLNNWLVMHSMSDTLVDWTVVREQLTTRNNADVLSQLIDEHIGHGLLSESVVLLDSLDAIIPSLTLSTEQLEMEDFSLFKRYLLTVVDEEGILRSVPDSVMEHLQYFADSLTGKAARQAQNLMCFHRGMCTELEVQMPITIKSMTQISDEDPARFYRLPKLKAIPNPSTGEFQLEVPEGCAIAELTICDIQGRAVSFVQNEQKDNRAKIELNAMQNGVVIVTAKCTDGASYSTRLVINN